MRAMTKVELFNRNLQETSQVFKAFSHPARLAILKYLAETKVCISGDISNELPLSRTTVNQHLKELKEVGLIKGDFEGTRVNYCLNTTVIQQVRKILDHFLDEINCSENNKCE
jgi:ArsR family transcriptional regulator, arsenate/arsenite/antimonite-responsive transcriptional repressor